MKTGDLAKALRGMAKKGLFVNHQEAQLLKDAALTVEDQARRIAELEAELARRDQVALPLPEKPGDDFWEEDNCE